MFFFFLCLCAARGVDEWLRMDHYLFFFGLGNSCWPSWPLLFLYVVQAGLLGLVLLGLLAFIKYYYGKKKRVKEEITEAHDVSV